MTPTLLQPEGCQPCAIAGLGVYRPRRVVENAEIAAGLGVDAQWIESRCGIRSRRFADHDETLVMMAAHAGRAALTAAGAEASQVDHVLLLTSSNVRQMPALAPALAFALGASGAGACDLNAACSGFTYGLLYASALIGAGQARHVLVVATERMRDLVDPGDRSTAIIFADGAGAALVSASQEPGIGPASWGNDGSAEQLLILEPDFTQLDADHPRPYMRMNGLELAHRVPDLAVGLARRTLATAGLSWKDLVAFIPHQANRRLNDICAERLGLPAHVTVANTVTHDGNTSAASIPLAAHHLITEQLARPGDLAMLLGYGVGLTWTAMIVRLPPISI
ncbi:ketoacyl-ACP synthase III [Streptomyces lunalinharesii]|uniref:Ketoacyl-ACP synthase III n=1 Tax=Streptomyces lunalinharesii TaxID=333384 RepID=A0ABP6DZL6_9ACTN